MGTIVDGRGPACPPWIVGEVTTGQRVEVARWQ